jgi:hypothetical protein
MLGYHSGQYAECVNIDDAQEGTIYEIYKDIPERDFKEGTAA